jgi:hypothetical protein
VPWPSTSGASRPHPDAAGSLTRHRGVHRDTVDPDGGWSAEADQVLHPQRVVQRLGMEPRDVRRRADRGDEPGRPAAGTGDALTTVDVRARASPRGTATARPQPLHGSCRRTRDRRRTGHRSASRRVLGRGRPGGRCLRPSRSHACRVDPPDRARPTTSVLVGGALWNVYRRQAAVPGLVAVGDSVATTTPTRGRGIAMAYLHRWQPSSRCSTRAWIHGPWPTRSVRGASTTSSRGWPTTVRSTAGRSGGGAARTWT